MIFLKEDTIPVCKSPRSNCLPAESSGSHSAVAMVPSRLLTAPCKASTPVRHVGKLEPEFAATEKLLHSSPEASVTAEHQGCQKTVQPLRLEHPFAYIEDIYAYVKSDAFQQKKVFTVRGFLQVRNLSMRVNFGLDVVWTLRLVAS